MTTRRWVLKRHNELDFRLAEAIIATIRQPLLVLNAELRVEKANSAFHDLFNVTPEQTLGRLVYELGNGQWNIPALRDLLDAVLGGEELVENFKVEHEFEDIGHRIMLLNAHRVEGEDVPPHLILLAITDVTDLERTRFELEGEKEYAEKLTDSVREALIVLGCDLRVKHANLTFYETFRVRPDETEGRMIYDLGNGQWNIPRLRRLLEDILPQQKSFDDYEVEHNFKTIGPRIMLLNGRRLDHKDLILLAVRDVTEKVHLEHARMQLASIVESSDDGIYSIDFDGTITSWNKGAERLFGYLFEEVIGKPITILIPPEHDHEEDVIIERVRRGNRVEHYETVRRRKDGGLVDVSLTASPMRDAAGKIVSASKIARDITDRKRSEAQISILAREAEHRAKNLLANVRAMIHLSQADTADGLKRAIEGRIEALASVHSLFAESRWAGAELGSLIKRELSPYSRDGGMRTLIDGPAIMLKPDLAQTMAVALHELATNAAKYGALSVAAGRVRVTWARSANVGKQFMLRWTEAGGPSVKPPTGKGFGTHLMETMIRRHEGGDVHLDWHAEGLVCEISLPA
jgi:PAS domain S-box-containing protein